MANYGGYQPYPRYIPNAYSQSPQSPANPPVPPPYSTSSQPYVPSPNPASHGVSSPYPQSHTGYNRPPPPSPHGPPQSPYPGQAAPQYGQQNPWAQQQQQYGQQNQWGQPQQQPYGQQSQWAQPYPQPGAYPPNQPAQGQQYGAPAPGQQYGTPYGAPPPQVQASPAEVGAYRQLLQGCIQEKSLQFFYPPNSPVVDQIANSAPALINQVMREWRLVKEVANDVVKLALYDIVLYIDDSGSMAFEENGERIKDLKEILQRVSFAATLFDRDGVSVRFMNTDLPSQLQDGVATKQRIDEIMRGVQFKGLTPMGTALKNKVLDGIVAKASSGQLKKPVLVITVTDGQPAGEPQDAVFNNISHAFNALQNYPCGKGALALEFAQVGNDENARKFLGRLDEHPAVGPMVDCTSNYENEQDEMSRANPPINLTPDLWVVKLLLGAIDSSYDTKDEKGNRPTGAPGGYGAAPAQHHGYGAPPPGGYGHQGYQPPMGQYGAPPPGAPYGQPQPGYQPGPGQYPQQQRPPQAGGYPGQSHYGAPPGGRY